MGRKRQLRQDVTVEHVVLQVSALARSTSAHVDLFAIPGRSVEIKLTNTTRSSRLT